MKLLRLLKIKKKPRI